MAKNHSVRFLEIVNSVRENICECEVHHVKARLDAGETLTIIDVREESEFSAGRIPGATHIGKGVIERDIESKHPDVDVELILYCGGGYRSALAADALQKMGYQNVISMDGGMRGWREAGHPEEN